MKQVKINKGEPIFFKVTLKSSNFDQHKDKFKILLLIGGAVVAEYDQNDVGEDINGDQFLCVDTSGMPTGELYAKAVAYTNEPLLDTGKITKTAVAACGIDIITTVQL